MRCYVFLSDESAHVQIKGHIRMLFAECVKFLITERADTSKEVGITAKRS